LTPEIQQLKINGSPSTSDKKTELEKGGGDGRGNTPTIRLSKAKRDKMNPKEKRECEVVERLIKTYFLIIRKNIQVERNYFLNRK